MKYGYVAGNDLKVGDFIVVGADLTRLGVMKTKGGFNNVFAAEELQLLDAPKKHFQEYTVKAIRQSDMEIVTIDIWPTAMYLVIDHIEDQPAEQQQVIQ